MKHLNKKITRIFLVFSILSLATSIMFWLDSYNRHLSIKNQKLTNKESACYERLLFQKGLINFLAKKENFTVKEISSFFSYNEKSLLHSVQEDNFEWKAIYNNGYKYDTILQLKSWPIFFLFKDDLFIGTFSGCEKTKSVETYLKKNGEYKIND